MRHGVIVIGCGAMARVHCHALMTMPQVKLISAVDVQLDRAKEFQRQFGFERAGADYKGELERKDADIILVATHWAMRHQIISDCFHAGKHVLAEKPLSVYAREVEDLIRLANRKKLKLRVGMVERFRAMFLTITDLLNKATIGKPQVYNFIHHQRPTPSAMEAGWEYFKKLLHGGVTPNLDCGIHKCDLVRMFSHSDAASVMSWGRKLEPDSPSCNFTHSVFTMRDGTIFTLEDCFSGCVEPFVGMWIIGDKGRMQFEYAGHHARPTPGSEEDCIRIWHRTPPRTETLHISATMKAVRPQMETFIQEIEQDKDLNWHYDNVSKATEMVAATVLSEHRHAAVNFPLTSSDWQAIENLIKQ